MAEELDFDDIKKLVIIALFSIDELFEIIVLKGGNAMDLIYKVSARASFDIDISLDGDLPEDIESISTKIQESLKRVFSERGYMVFDFIFLPRPKTSEGEKDDFWGGYRGEFKIIRKEDFNMLDNNIEKIRRNATIVSPGHKRIFYIEFSKHECCKQKVRKELDDYYIFAYSPEMLIIEKIRSICQQMREYEHLRHLGTARARDFIDIFVFCEHFDIELTEAENIQLLKDIFEAKRVPLELMGKIEGYREFHRGDFPSVKDTIKPDFHIKTFDYYFDYLLDRISPLKALWDI